MDSPDSFRDRFDALEQGTEQLRHNTRTVERRLRWWRGIAGCLPVLDLLSWVLLLSLGMLGLLMFPTVGAADLVINGDFEAGNTGFSTGYTFSPGDVTPAETYTVDTNPLANHPLFSPCGDHTTGTGKMMIVNGSEQPSVTVWSQTVAVLSKHTYEFSAWATSVFPDSPARLQFSINNSIIGELHLSSTTCQWQPFITSWFSGESTTAVLRIIDLNTEAFGNDFALDDLSFEVLAPAFAGTPGKANCHGKSVSALARQFGGIDAAASALGFASVQALQDAIRTFCAE